MFDTRKQRLALAGAATIAAGVAVAVPMQMAVGDGHNNTVLETQLSGQSEVVNDASNQRIVGDPDGRGEAFVFGLDSDTLCYVLTVEKIAPATDAHIHEAPAGVSGPVIVPLAAPSDGDSANCVDVDAALAADILANPAEYYVNVHNADFPGGAVRGQLAPQQ